MCACRDVAVQEMGKHSLRCSSLGPLMTRVIRGSQMVKYLVGYLGAFFLLNGTKRALAQIVLFNSADIC